MTLPATMNAFLLNGHGGQEKLEHRTDVPVPRPASGEVLIAVHACGMNNTDIKVREAAYAVNYDPESGASESESAASISTIDGQTSLCFPRIQGADIVGEIVMTGEGVSKSRCGQRVLVDFSIYHGRDEKGAPVMDLANVDYIGHGRDGGFAEYVTVPSENAHYIKRDMSAPELATFGCSTLTAEHMLARINLKAGQRVLVTGAGGGVGSSAVQLVRARGAVPCVVTSHGKERVLQSLGAETCIFREDFTDAQGQFDGAAFMEAAAAAAGRKHGFDAVVDQVGGAMFNCLLQSLKPDGHYITAGTIAGYMPRINLHTVYMAFLNIHGSSQGTPEDFRRIVEYIENGKIKPVLGDVFKLSELKQAQKAFQEKKHIGSIVVVPDKQWEKR